MAESRRLTYKEIKASDAVIDGLFTGALAGLAMVAVLILAGLLRGEDPAGILNRFAPGQANAPLTGFLMHLAVSGIYGMLYGLIWMLILQVRTFNPAPAKAALLGGIFGLLLLLAAWFILLPASASPLREVPFLHMAAAHLIYGAVLGLALYRVQMNR